MAQEVSLAVVNNVNSTALRPSVDLPSRDSQRRDAEQLWQATVQAVSRSAQVDRPSSHSNHQSLGSSSLVMEVVASTAGTAPLPMCLSMQLNAAARTKRERGRRVASELDPTPTGPAAGGVSLSVAL